MQLAQCTQQVILCGETLQVEAAKHFIFNIITGQDESVRAIVIYNLGHDFDN